MTSNPPTHHVHDFNPYTHQHPSHIPPPGQPSSLVGEVIIPPFPQIYHPLIGPVITLAIDPILMRCP